MQGKQRWLAGLVLGVVLGIGVTLLAVPAHAAGSAGWKAPAFTLKLFNGGELDSKTLTGKVVVVRFLASW